MIAGLPERAMASYACFRFSFAENGRYGTCLRATGADLVLESWALATEKARARTVSGITVDSATQALPLNDGRILLFRSNDGTTSHSAEVAVLQPTGDEFALHRLGDVAGYFGYLLPSPSSAQLGFAVTFDGLGHSTIWRLSGSQPSIESLAKVPGSLDGGVWLDSDAWVLAVNQASGKGRSGVAVDLRDGSWKRIWSVSDTSTDRILCYSSRSKRVVVSTTASGAERLGWAILGERTVHFPETVHRAGYDRHALALDEMGERVLIEEVAGAVSRLLVYSLADDDLVPVPAPLGTISAPASWTGDLVRFGFSAPNQPPTLATVRLGTPPRWSVSRDPALDSRPVGPPAELVELPGPAGAIEAIAYGGRDWRLREHLVVALHGGPLSSWRFKFEPLFQCLSAAGVAVVAPNYPGSTGYGEQHLRAVFDGWGGRDLDDVRALGLSLRKDRESRQLPRPVVLGMSYGAFLALLAACREPELWSACVAMAPFLSGPRFHESASDVVRQRIEHLGGLNPIDDALGPRDVVQVCASLSAPLLLTHGTRDETVPVAQSRMLRRRLLELGRAEDVDFEYVEVETDHSGLFDGQEALIQRVVRFCRARSELDSCRRPGSPQALPALAGSGRKPVTVEEER